ncbi:NUDIX hydrolase [Clostridium senegalense]|uniref:NUDIX hydrolase n=1 Tax=Clostridium senegalense TaxID=1465809 RepID=UPI0002888FC2|nr:NUDIX domain-containing protein [Clostridium senegalense]
MEVWDIYDKNGYKTGKVKEKGEKLNSGEYHLAMEAWIINSDSKILVQKRSNRCDILPGVWGLTTGRMISGENSIDGCIREVNEELGIKISEDEMEFMRRIFRTDLIWDLYLVRKDIDLEELVLQENEVAEAKWITVNEFKEMLEEGRLFKYPEIYEILDLVEGDFH